MPKGYRRILVYGSTKLELAQRELHQPRANTFDKERHQPMAHLTAVLLFCQLASPTTRETALLRTWEAITWRESRNNPRALNKKENAAGIGQIKPIMVAECNRLQKARTFTLAQRFDSLLSFEMFRIHSLAHAPNGTPEQWARLWNGGASGLKKKATVAYGKDIVRIMRERP